MTQRRQRHRRLAQRERYRVEMEVNGCVLRWYVAVVIAALVR